MVKFKKLLAVIMTASLVFSMTACSKDKDDKDKDDKETSTESEKGDDKSDEKGDDKSEVEDIYEAFAMAPEYKGEYTFEVSLVNDLESKAEMVLGTNGLIDGTNATMGLNVSMSDSNGTDLELVLDEFVIVADGMLYLDIDSLLKSISDVDTSMGSYGIPLPDVDVNAAKDLEPHVLGILKALFTNVEAEKDGDTFTIKLSEAEDYYEGIKAVVAYIDENRDEINDAIMASAESVDIKAYLKELIDFVSEDLLSAAELLGAPITQEQIDEVADQIDSLETDVPEDVDLFEEFDDVVANMDNFTLEDVEKSLEELDASIEMVVTAGDDYSFELSFVGDDGEQSVEFAASYEIKSGSVKIGEPDDVTTLTDAVKYVMDNPDVFQDVVKGIQQWAESINEAFPNQITTPIDPQEPSQDEPVGKVEGNSVTFDCDVTVSWDEDVIGSVDCSEESYSVFLYADDEWETEIDIQIDEYSDAEENYQLDVDFYGEDDCEHGTVTANGIEYYCVQGNGSEVVYYYADVNGVCVCLTTFSYEGYSDYTSLEMVEALTIK